MLKPEEVEGKDVLEAGSYDVNGTLRPIIEAWKPKRYIGTDILPGPGVDMVVDAVDLVHHFGGEKFDVVITTEMLEHAEKWQETISNLKNMVKPGGILLVTTRSKGMNYHAYPHDYWRYEISDMEHIFADFEIIRLEKDLMCPGVFLKARRPLNFKEKNLDTYALYSIVTGTKQTRSSPSDYETAHFKRLRFKMKVNEFIGKSEQAVRAIGRALIGWKG